MKQGNVGAFLVRKPIAPAGASAFRTSGERMADEWRAALITAAKSCDRYPAPELMERLRPERGRSISLAAFCEAIIAVANARTLKMPTWRRFLGTLAGSIDALIVAIVATPVQSWSEEQEAQRLGDRTQERVFLNWEQATVLELNEAIVAIDCEMDAKHRLRAHLATRKAALLARQAVRA